MAQDGYDSNSIIGKTGLEKLYESSLRGTDGCEILILNSDGSLKETLGYQAAMDGQDVHLTLDASLCETLYNQLGEDSGSCSGYEHENRRNFIACKHPFLQSQ